MILSIVVVGIKVVNHLLHHMFDTTDCLEEELTPATPTTNNDINTPVHHPNSTLPTQQMRLGDFHSYASGRYFYFFLPFRPLSLGVCIIGIVQH